MNDHYFNTTHSAGSELAEYEAQAASQEDLILAHMRKTGWVGRTPSDVQGAFMPQTPITSVRRAMTNLASAGKLIKTLEQRRGPFGRPEYVWRVPEEQGELELKPPRRKP